MMTLVAYLLARSASAGLSSLTPYESMTHGILPI